MVKNAENNQIGLLLDVVLQETIKHRELLKHLSSVFESDQPVSPRKCEEQMGQFFREAISTIHSVKEEVLRGLPVVDAARRLVVFEKGASEEYVAEMHTKIRSLAERDTVVGQILESIAEDEKGHVSILEQIIQIASRN